MKIKKDRCKSLSFSFGFLTFLFFAITHYLAVEPREVDFFDEVVGIKSRYAELREFVDVGVKDRGRRRVHGFAPLSYDFDKFPRAEVVRALDYGMSG